MTLWHTDLIILEAYTEQMRNWTIVIDDLEVESEIQRLWSILKISAWLLLQGYKDTKRSLSKPEEPRID